MLIRGGNAEISRAISPREIVKAMKALPTRESGAEIMYPFGALVKYLRGDALSLPGRKTL